MVMFRGFVVSSLSLLISLVAFSSERESKRSSVALIYAIHHQELIDSRFVSRLKNKIETRDLAGVEEVVLEGAKPVKRSYAQLQNAFHLAVKEASIQVLQKLIELEHKNQIQQRAIAEEDKMLEKVEELPENVEEKATVAVDLTEEIGVPEVTEVAEVKSELILPPLDPSFLLTVDRKGRTVFHFALEEYYKIWTAEKRDSKEPTKKALEMESILSYLLDLNRDLLLQLDSLGQSPLHLAALAGDEERVASYLAMTDDLNFVNKIDRQGRTALRCAAENECFGVADLLLAKVPGLIANPNPGRYFIAAASLARLDLIFYFCMKYKNQLEVLRAVNTHNNTAIHLLVFEIAREREEVQRRIEGVEAAEQDLGSESDLEEPRIERMDSSTLPIKARYQPLQAFKALVEAIKEISPETIDAQNFDGKTALHLAVEFSLKEAVQILLDNDVNTRVRDRTERTPWLWLKEVKGKEGITREEEEIRELIKNKPRWRSDVLDKLHRWSRSLRKEEFQSKIKRHISDDRFEDWAATLKSSEE